MKGRRSSSSNPMAVSLFLFMVLLESFSCIHGSGYYYHRLREVDSIKASFLQRTGISPSLAFAPSVPPSSRVYRVTAYGADPTGQTDSTDAILRAISDAFRATSSSVLMPGIPDLGGAEVHLEGGSYKISRPLRLPASGGGNFMIHGGSLRASDNFPDDRHLIELWPSSTPKLQREGKKSTMTESLSSTFPSSYEYITLRDLMLDSNFRGGAISVINSVRITIDNCYITHFTSDGILVQGGHETFIRNSFIGQHITAGGDPGEKSFSGIGINLMGNDNIVTDVVIFSAEVGVMVAGQANTLTGVHCYNKATGWGGTGIYIRLPGLSQTRILNCYLDYTGIVAEDPVQLHISGSFFLGNAFILLKSVKGEVRGLNVVDNMFSGDNKGVDIVQLDESSRPFTNIEQVVVERNNAQGMKVRSTVASKSVEGNGTTFAVDFSDVLLFSDFIQHTQYTFHSAGSFPNHVLRNMSKNQVVIETDLAVPATVYIAVDQSTLGN